MARTKIRVLDGNNIEFYSSGNTRQTTLGHKNSGSVDHFRLTHAGDAFNFDLMTDTTGKFEAISFYDGGTSEIWTIGKDINNDFFIGNSNNSVNFFQIINSSSHLVLQSSLAGNVGISIVPSSSFLQIAAGTTSLAPFRLTSASATLLTTITADCLEYNGDTLFYTNQIAYRQSVSFLIYACDNEHGPNGTTANTSLLNFSDNPTWKKQTVPASFFINGKTLKVKGWGYYSTDVLGSSFQVEFKFGSNMFRAATPVFTPTLNQTNQFWQFELLFTCRNAGASARFSTSGADFSVGSLQYNDNGTTSFAYFTVTNGVNDTFNSGSADNLNLNAQISGTAYTGAKFMAQTIIMETSA